MSKFLPIHAKQEFKPGNMVVVPANDPRIVLPEERKRMGMFWQSMAGDNGVVLFSGRFGAIQHVAYCEVKDDNVLLWKGDGPLFHDGPTIEPGALARPSAIVIPVLFQPDNMIYVGMNKAQRTAIVDPETLEQGVETWEFPGGYSLEGEDPIDQVRRHALEESGYELEGIDFLGAASSNRMSVPTCITYFAARFNVVSETAAAQGFEDILGQAVYRIDQVPVPNYDGLTWTAWALLVHKMGLIDPQYYTVERLKQSNAEEEVVRNGNGNGSA
ncbi:hypothetical protein IID21_03245 [Patescibacteria group bacterium]|nr:hypothetical protein [Patescibacteria group bacterium]